MHDALNHFAVVNISRTKAWPTAKWIIIFSLVRPVSTAIESSQKEVGQMLAEDLNEEFDSLFLAYTACNKKYCAEHFACSICESKMNEKSKFFDVDAKPVCKGCYGKLPSQSRKSVQQYQKKKPVSSIFKQNAV